MWKVLRFELLKLKKSPIWLLVFVSPALSSLVGLVESEINNWLAALGTMAFLHAMLFLPLLTGVFAAFVCRYEHIGGGWKMVLAMPVTRTSVYMVKFLLVLGLLALTQLLFMGGLLLIGEIKGYSGEIPWGMVLKSIWGGWVACMPLAALQMFVSVAWSSFAAPMAVNVMFTLPNILVANSEKYGPYYPWAQPLLAMIPASNDSFGAFLISAETLFFIIIGSFFLFFTSGYLYFQRKEI